MALEWKIIGGPEAGLAPRQLRVHVTLIVTKLIAHYRKLGQLLIDAGKVGQWFGRTPFSLKRESRSDCILLARSDDTQKIIAPYDLRAGNAANRVGVHRKQFRAERW